MAVVGWGRGLVGEVDIIAIELELVQRCEPSICQPINQGLSDCITGAMFIFIFNYFINK